MRNLVFKPVVKVWYLPESTRATPEHIYATVGVTLQKVSALKVPEQDCVMVLFPSGITRPLLGTDVLIECLVPPNRLTPSEQRDVAVGLVDALKKHFPEAFIQSQVSEYSGGYCSTLVE